MYVLFSLPRSIFPLPPFPLPPVPLVSSSWLHLSCSSLLAGASAYFITLFTHRSCPPVSFSLRFPCLIFRYSSLLYLCHFIPFPFQPSPLLCSSLHSPIPLFVSFLSSHSLLMFPCSPFPSFLLHSFPLFYFVFFLFLLHSFPLFTSSF